MDYSIAFSSKTGNTEILAEAIRTVLPPENRLYFGRIDGEYVDAPALMIGFWTDKGTCDDATKAYLKTLKNKMIFLFGTAGFGEDSKYYEKILTSVKQNIDISNQVIGTYMCQGKMPMSIRQRCGNIENFDRALSHPDLNDCNQIQQQVVEWWDIQLYSPQG